MLDPAMLPYLNAALYVAFVGGTFAAIVASELRRIRRVRTRRWF